MSQGHIRARFAQEKETGMDRRGEFPSEARDETYTLVRFASEFLLLALSAMGRAESQHLHFPGRVTLGKSRNLSEPPFPPLKWRVPAEGGCTALRAEPGTQRPSCGADVVIPDQERLSVMGGGGDGRGTQNPEPWEGREPEG